MSDIFGKKLGQYILLEQLGEGGMAKVYNALDSRAEKNVAIKVILPSRRSSLIFLQQFEQEAKALANLTHTNVVKVLNYGIEDGQPYLVMDFIPGGTLKEAMVKPLPWQTAAAILAPIARALEYVHRQQIIHRDVKPSNILLYEDFHPMLSDFGIMKLLEAKEENINSAIGVGVGTPEYMSPEQGMGKEVDFRADIYSLGLVFYEMVTGEKPFTADTPMAAIIKHVTDDFPLPSMIDKKIPKFVESAILRAVQKNPEDRYISMGHFAEVLEMIALGEKVPKKRIVSLSNQKVKKLSPNIYILLLLLLIIGVSSIVFGYRNNFGLQRTEISKTTSVAGVENQNIDKTAISNQPADNNSGQNTTSVPVEKPTSLPIDTSSPEITLLGTPLVNIQTSQFKETARWGIGGVNVVKWSPNGEFIALGTTSGIFLYDSNSKELNRFINTGFDVVEMAFNPDGDNIVAGSLDGQIKVWSVQSGKFVRDFLYVKPNSDRITVDKRVNVISYSQNGKNIAIGYEDGALNYFTVNQNSPDMVVGQYPSVEDLVISADNRFMYVSNGTNNIMVWDIATKKKISELSNPTPINKLKLSQDRQFLLSGGNGNTVYMWDLSEVKLVTSFSNLGSLLTDFDFSYDDKLVAISLNTGTMKVFAKPDPRDYSKILQPILTIEGSGDQIRSLAFSPDQIIIASGNWEDGLKLWNAKAGNEIFSLNKSMGGINEIYFSKDGSWLATAHDGGRVRIWQVNTAQEVYQFDGYLPKGSPFSPNDLFLAIIHNPEKYKPGSVQIVELSSGNIVAEIPGYQPNSLVQFTDDSKLFVTGNSRIASIWDVTTWEQLNTHGGFNNGCGQYFTPQNDLLAVVSDAGILFTLNNNIQDMCTTKPEGATLVYYFQSNHKIFFVLGDGNLWSWNFLSKDIVSIVRTRTTYPFSNEVFLAGDQESGWYAYTSSNKLIVNAGIQYTVSESQDDYHYRVAFSPKQKLIALGSKYGSVHIWTMP